VCRLFGLSGGARRVRATFWLIEAPDSLAKQSRRNPDGYGLGTFRDDDIPKVDKAPVPAYADPRFAAEARHESSRTFVAHVRYASTGDRRLENTHPFEMAGRVFAHNGHVGGLERLEAELGADMELVRGQTDSERVFALINRETAARDGDVGAGITAAAMWIAAELPLFALNVVLATPEELWALRYPDTHELWVLERGAGGPGGDRHLDAASAAGTVRVRSEPLARHPSVIVASERMDEDPGWRLLESGELLHVGPALQVDSSIVLDRPPAQLLTLADLDPTAAAAQAPPSGPRPNLT
jgi:predicted glutamine amidotransferase